MKQLVNTTRYRGWEIEVFKSGERAFQTDLYLPSGERCPDISSTWFTLEVALEKAKAFIDEQPAE